MGKNTKVGNGKVWAVIVTEHSGSRTITYTDAIFSAEDRARLYGKALTVQSFFSGAVNVVCVALNPAMVGV